MKIKVGDKFYSQEYVEAAVHYAEAEDDYMSCSWDDNAKKLDILHPLCDSFHAIRIAEQEAENADQ
jgi:hypothetical protein